MKILKRYISKPTGIHSMVLKKFPIDYEIATMVLSAIVYKRNIGPIIFCGDSKAVDFMEWSGLSNLYEDIRYIYVDPRINQETFWAAGKIASVGITKGPRIIIDLDAVIWNKPSAWDDVTVLHEEPKYWESYSWNSMWEHARDLIGIKSCPRVHPLNTAILALNDEKLANEYQYIAEALMIRASMKGVKVGSKVSIKGSGSDVPVTEMVFAEQYSLAMLAHSRGVRIGKITSYDPASDHPVKNRNAIHLWNSKRFYNKHDRAREAYLSWAMEQIWSLVSGTQQESIVQGIAHTLGLPTIRVVDGNSNAVRWSRQGEWFGPGETVVRL